MTSRNHLHAAARCWERAGFYEDAAERFTRAEAWYDAGRCFSQAHRHHDAALAYSRAEEPLLEARQHLMSSWPERARSLYERLRHSPFLSPREKVEVLLGLGDVAAAARLTSISNALEVLDRLARLGIFRSRPDILALIAQQPQVGSAACGDLGFWNRSLSQALRSSKGIPNQAWPKAQFRGVNLVQLWEIEVVDFMWSDSALDWSSDGTSFVSVIGTELAFGQVGSDGVRVNYFKPTKVPSCVRFLPGSRDFYIGCTEGNVLQMNRHGYVQDIEHLRLPGDIGSICFSPDGKSVALTAGINPGAILEVYGWIWDQWEKQTSEKRELENFCVPLAAWAPGDALVWSPGPLDHLNRLYFSGGGVLQAHENVISSLGVTPDERFLITASTDQNLQVRDFQNVQQVLAQKHFGCRVLSTASNSRLGLLAVGEGNRLHLLRLESFDKTLNLVPLTECLFDDELVASLAFSPDSHLLLVMTGNEWDSGRTKGHLHLFRVELRP